MTKFLHHDNIFRRPDIILDIMMNFSMLIWCNVITTFFSNFQGQVWLIVTYFSLLISSIEMLAKYFSGVILVLFPNFNGIDSL